MNTYLRLATVALASAVLSAQSSELLARWTFDEATGPSALDTVSATRDTITGFHQFVAGISGNALQFDGYTTHIVRPYKTVPVPKAGFTVEAWVEVRRLVGSDLVIWIELQSTVPVRIELEPAAAADLR